MDLFTANGMPFKETARQTVSVRQGGVSVTRYVQIRGLAESDYAKGFLGWAELDDAGGLLRRNLPEFHPKFPDHGRGLGLPATSFEYVRELGEPSQDAGQGDALVFDFCEYAVTYERDEANAAVAYLPDEVRPPTNPNDELWRWCHRRVEYEAHGVTVPRNVLEFVVVNGGGGHDPVPEPGVQQVAESTLYVTWYGVPAYFSPLVGSPPFLHPNLQSNIDKCVMRVNSVSFDQTYPPLTVLALPPKRVLRTQSDLWPVWDLTYPFAVRGGPDLSAGGLDATGTATPDWTRILRVDGKYWKVRRRPDPTKAIYDTADLSYLFSFKLMP